MTAGQDVARGLSTRARDPEAGGLTKERVQGCRGGYPMAIHEQWGYCSRVGPTVLRTIGHNRFTGLHCSLRSERFPAVVISDAR